MAEKITKSNLSNGKILAGFRKQNKITQSALGEMIGLDSRDISKYETGHRAIPQEAVDYLNSKYNLKLKSTGKVVNYKIEGKGLKVSKVKSSKKVKAKSIKVVSKKKSSWEAVSKSLTFGERVALVRKTLKLSQKDFAEKFGFSQAHLSQIESDKAKSISIQALQNMYNEGINIRKLLQ